MAERPVSRFLPGSVELPTTARRALRRHRTHTWGTGMGRFVTMLQRPDLATFEQRVARPLKEAGVDPIGADVAPVQPQAARARARAREGLPHDQRLGRAQAGDDDIHRSVVESLPQDGACTRLRGFKGPAAAVAQSAFARHRPRATQAQPRPKRAYRF